MTTTDPEYDRAGEEMQRLFDVARKMADEKHLAVLAYAEECRTRSTPPDPVPLRVEPPEEHRGENHHWLIHNDGGMRVWFWRGPSWTHFDDLTHYAPDRVASLGWRYHAPCKPDTRIEPTPKNIRNFIFHYPVTLDNAQQTEDCVTAALSHFTPPSRIEVSEEATDERCSKPGCGALAGLCSDADCPQLNLTRAQVAEYYAMKRPRFAASAKTQPPCWPRDLHALEHATAPALNGAVMYFRTEADRNAFMDWMCAQDDPPAPTPPAPVQQAEADEDERKWLVYYHDKEVPPELFARGGNAEECARKRHANQLNAWNCHLFREVFPGEPATPTITKDQWEEIRKLAITQAPQVFEAEARKVIGL